MTGFDDDYQHGLLPACRLTTSSVLPLSAGSPKVMEHAWSVKLDESWVRWLAPLSQVALMIAVTAPYLWWCLPEVPG